MVRGSIPKSSKYSHSLYLEPQVRIGNPGKGSRSIPWGSIGLHDV